MHRFLNKIKLHALCKGNSVRKIGNDGLSQTLVRALLYETVWEEESSPFVVFEVANTAFLPYTKHDQLQGRSYFAELIRCKLQAGVLWSRKRPLVHWLGLMSSYSTAFSRANSAHSLTLAISGFESFENTSKISRISVSISCKQKQEK